MLAEGATLPNDQAHKGFGQPFAPIRSTRIVANISLALQPTSDRAKVRMAATSRVATARLGVPWGCMPRLGEWAVD